MDEKTEKIVRRIMEKDRELFAALAAGTPEVRRPTKERNEYWIWAFNKRHQPGDPDTKRVGKWLIFVKEEEIDEAWALVREATQDGLLGFVSKASTARSFPPHDRYVICVYNNDYTDLAEVHRILRELLALGLQPARYKTDHETKYGTIPSDYKPSVEMMG